MGVETGGAADHDVAAVGGEVAHDLAGAEVGDLGDVGPGGDGAGDGAKEVAADAEIAEVADDQVRNAGAGGGGDEQGGVGVGGGVGPGFDALAEEGGTDAAAVPALVALELEGAVLAAEEIALHDAADAAFGEAVLRSAVGLLAGEEHVADRVEDDISRLGHGGAP